MESDLRTIADPIFRAAGLNPDQIRVIVLGDDSVNAFVAGGQNLFIHTGLLLDAKNVGELGGVIAHEAGHMAGGHLIRMRTATDRASVENIIAMIAGVAVGVGAGDSGAGMATALGGGEFANRRMLQHSRTLESSADQAGMDTIERMGYSLTGMRDFLERLSGEEVLPELQRSGYILTHPLSRERMETVEAYVAKSRHKDDPWPAAWNDKFLRLQAKILAYTEPAQALNEYQSNTSLVARYAVAIADYRQGHIADALKLIAQLQKEEPTNAFFYDTQGQILFEQGDVDGSIAAYRKAAVLAPQIGLIHLSLAQALLQRETGSTSEALDHLQQARNNGERNTSLVYRWLAVAYGRSGDEGQAKLALAEEALLKGDYSFCIQQADRAKKLLKSDPSARQRADDLIAAAGRAQKDKQNRDD